MFSIIIADDEEIERKALRLFITKNLPEFVILDDAVNGIDLINKIEKDKPDIAIVDINMPGIDGLESIKIIKQKELKTKLIIHTAYNYFEYAQKALELGADDYILKPEKRDKILQTLYKCIEKIKEEREKEEEAKRIESMVGEISPLIQTDFITSIIIGDVSSEKFKVYLNILRIKFTAGYIMTLNIEEAVSKEQGKDEIEINETKKEMSEFIRTEMSSICSCIVGPVINDKISVFVSLEDPMDEYSLKVWATELAELVIKRIKRNLDIKISAGIGLMYDNIENMPKSYKESMRALNDKTLCSSIKHYGDFFNDMQIANPFINREKDILSSISKLNGDKCTGIFNEIFKEIDDIKEIKILQDMVLSFSALINREITESYNISNYELTSLRAVFREVTALNTKEELEYWIRSRVLSIIDDLKKERRSKINSFVKKAIEYINENYSRDISLENVAESTGVSPYYLSRLFKQELNENFVDYLTNVRIEHAIKLIKENSYSIRELSERVGYMNPTYFCKVFKKSTGKTIGEMRPDLY